MIHTIKVVYIIENAELGTVEVGVVWNDSDSVFTEIFPSKAQMIEVVQDPVTLPSEAIRFALSWWLARDPDGSDPDRILGKTMTVDFSDPVPIKVG